MQVRLNWRARKHELIPEEGKAVIQMNLNQSACDRIADFALAESGASYGSFRKNSNFLTCHFKVSFFVFIMFAEE